MLKGESLLDYINLLSPNDYENNNKKYKKMKNEKKRWRKHIALFAVSIENLKNVKYHNC